MVFSSFDLPGFQPFRVPISAFLTTTARDPLGMELLPGFAFRKRTPTPDSRAAPAGPGAGRAAAAASDLTLRTLWVFGLQVGGPKKMCIFGGAPLVLLLLLLAFLWASAGNIFASDSQRLSEGESRNKTTAFLLSFSSHGYPQTKVDELCISHQLK